MVIFWSYHLSIQAVFLTWKLERSCLKRLLKSFETLIRMTSLGTFSIRVYKALLCSWRPNRSWSPPSFCLNPYLICITVTSSFGLVGGWVGILQRGFPAYHPQHTEAARTLITIITTGSRDWLAAHLRALDPPQSRLWSPTALTQARRALNQRVHQLPAAQLSATTQPACGSRGVQETEFSRLISNPVQRGIHAGFIIQQSPTLNKSKS